MEPQTLFPETQFTAEILAHFLVDLLAKGAVLLLAAIVLAALLKKATAATRHAVWLLAIVAVLLLPAMTLLLPRWHLDLRAASSSVALVSPRSAPASPGEPASIATDEPLVAASRQQAVFPKISPAATPADAPLAWHGALTDSLPMSFSIIWAIGLMALLLRLALAQWALARDARPPATDQFASAAEMLSQLCTTMEIRRPVSLSTSLRSTAPLTWGVFRPRIVLPANAPCWEADRLRAVLLHELAHVRRGDALAQWLLQLACALHWPNPLVWFAAARMGVERERACDDAVVRGGARASEYAAHLLAVAAGIECPRWSAGAALAMARRPRIEERLAFVLDPAIDRRGPSPRACLFCAAALTLIAVPAAVLHTAVADQPAAQFGNAIEEAAPVDPERSDQLPADPEPLDQLPGDRDLVESKPAGDSEPAGERKPDRKTAEAAAPAVNRVVDLARGRPIAGATVGLYRDRFDRSKPIGVMTTNELGVFEYPPETPEKENFYVEISALGYLTDEWLGNWNVYRRHKGVRRADTFVLHRPVTLAGQVLGPDGKPLADVPLSFDYFNPKVASINARKFNSDAEGRFRLEDLPPGELFVRLRCGDSPAKDEASLGGATFAIAHVHAADGEIHDDLVIDLSKSTCVLEGRLLDPTGQGIGGAGVAAAFQFSSGRLDHTIHAQTSDDGSFRMAGLPPGRFVMQLAHRQMNPVELRTGRPTRVELHSYLTGAAPPADRKAEPAWGDKAGGLRVAVVVEPSNDQYAFGEKLLVTVLLRNSSNQPVTATLNSLGGAAVEITDEEGKARTFDYSRFTGLIARDTYHLQPGHEVTFSGAFTLVLTDEREEPNDADNRDGFVVACRPGATYRLVCRVTGPDGSPPVDGKGDAEPGKLGLTTAPVTLVIAP